VDEFKERIRNEVTGEFDEISRERYFLTLQPQAAFVLIDHHTGHVLALRGIRGEKQTSRAFCRATQATRQPGSQFKPLATFLPAFDLGILSPASVIEDWPLFIPCEYGIRPDHRIFNWYRNPPYEGICTARRAIYHSGNVVSTRALQDYVGIDTMMNYLRRLGFSTIIDGEWRRGTWVTDRNLVTTLGALTDGVHLIEMAAAYGAIANGGMYNRPVLYSRVVDRHGNIVLQNHHEPRQIMRDTTAYLLTDSMKDTLTRGTGTAINWRENAQLRQNIPIAGKRGTTNDTRDLGFAGFTPYLTAAIWMGNDNNQPMSVNTVQGMAPARMFHGPLWRNIMQEIHEWERFTPRHFERPPSITTEVVCLDSGLLATELCNDDPRGNRARTEIFAPGTIPTDYCNVHQQHNVCEESGMLAGFGCSQSVSRIGIMRVVPIPEEFDGIVIRDRAFEFHPSVRRGEICNVCTGSFQEQWYFDGTDWIWGIPHWSNITHQNNAGQPEENYNPVYDVPPTENAPPSNLWGGQ